MGEEVSARQRELSARRDRIAVQIKFLDRHHPSLPAPEVTAVQVDPLLEVSNRDLYVLLLEIRLEMRDLGERVAGLSRIVARRRRPAGEPDLENQTASLH